MDKVKDATIIDRYVLKYDITSIFTEDMRPFMELLEFKKNQYICREGDDINYLFFFVEGRAKVYITLSNGKSLLLSFYDSFKVLGDLEFFNRQRASTNVQVIEDSYCIGISLKNVRTYLLNDAKFLRFTCNSLGEKLNRCSNNSSINLLYPLENRLASYILATGERIDRNGETRIIFSGNLTEISELLGTSYRHLLRTINTLCHKGVINKKNNYYEVIDEDNLREFSADLYK